MIPILQHLISFQLMEGEGFFNFKPFTSHIKQADSNFIESLSGDIFHCLSSPLPDKLSINLLLFYAEVALY